MNVKHEELTVRALYDLSYTAARPLLEACTYPWEALPKIGEFIKALGKTLSPEEYDQRGEDVWVAKSAKLYPNVYIAGPTIIGPETEVRPGAFIRGNALIGAGCVVGNSTMVLFLSTSLTEKLQEDLLAGGYPAATPAAIVYKATWPEEKIFRTTLEHLHETVTENGLTKTSLIVVGDCLGDQVIRSLLYHPGFTTEFREATQ